MSLKFYKCEVCGNIVCKIEDAGTPLTCCGKQMRELRNGETDGSLVYHLPDFRVSDNTVFIQVGSAAHPMEKMHHIQFIAIETSTGIHIRKLENNDEPVAIFKINEGEKVVSVYALCNLHGLFVTD